MTKVKLIKAQTEEELVFKINKFSLAENVFATQIYDRGYWVAFCYFKESKE